MRGNTILGALGAFGLTGLTSAQTYGASPGSEGSSPALPNAGSPEVGSSPNSGISAAGFPTPQVPGSVNGAGNPVPTVTVYGFPGSDSPTPGFPGSDGPGSIQSVPGFPSDGAPSGPGPVLPTPDDVSAAGFPSAPGPVLPTAGISGAGLPVPSSPTLGNTETSGLIRTITVYSTPGDSPPGPVNPGPNASGDDTCSVPVPSTVFVTITPATIYQMSTSTTIVTSFVQTSGQGVGQTPGQSGPSAQGFPSGPPSPASGGWTPPMTVTVPCASSPGETPWETGFSSFTFPSSTDGAASEPVTTDISPPGAGNPSNGQGGPDASTPTITTVTIPLTGANGGAAPGPFGVSSSPSQPVVTNTLPTNSIDSAGETPGDEKPTVAGSSPGTVTVTAAGVPNSGVDTSEAATSPCTEGITPSQGSESPPPGDGQSQTAFAFPTTDTITATVTLATLPGTDNGEQSMTDAPVTITLPFPETTMESSFSNGVSADSIPGASVPGASVTGSPTPNGGGGNSSFGNEESAPCATVTVSPSGVDNDGNVSEMGAPTPVTVTLPFPDASNPSAGSNDVTISPEGQGGSEPTLGSGSGNNPGSGQGGPISLTASPGVDQTSPCPSESITGDVNPPSGSAQLLPTVSTVTVEVPISPISSSAVVAPGPVPFVTSQPIISNIASAPFGGNGASLLPTSPFFASQGPFPGGDSGIFPSQAPAIPPNPAATSDVVNSVAQLPTWSGLAPQVPSIPPGNGGLSAAGFPSGVPVQSSPGTPLSNFPGVYGASHSLLSPIGSEPTIPGGAVPGAGSTPGAGLIPGAGPVPSAGSVPGVAPIPGSSSGPGAASVPGSGSAPGGDTSNQPIPVPAPSGYGAGIPGAGSIPGASPVPGVNPVPGSNPFPGAASVPGVNPVPGVGPVPSAGFVPGAGPVPSGYGAGFPSVASGPIPTPVPELPFNPIPAASQLPGSPASQVPSIPTLPSGFTPPPGPQNSIGSQLPGSLPSQPPMIPSVAGSIGPLGSQLPSSPPNPTLSIIGVQPPLPAPAFASTPCPESDMLPAATEPSVSGSVGPMALPTPGQFTSALPVNTFTSASPGTWSNMPSSGWNASTPASQNAPTPPTPSIPTPNDNMDQCVTTTISSQTYTWCPQPEPSQTIDLGAASQPNIIAHPEEQPTERSDGGYDFTHEPNIAFTRRDPKRLLGTQCGSPTDSGNFTFTLDDLPPLGVGAGEDPDSIHPMPMFSPYHRFWFASGFDVVPPPRQRFNPSSGSLMLQFTPVSAPASSAETATSASAKISVGPQQATGDFLFDLYGLSLGCDSRDEDCVFNITGMSWNQETGQEFSIASLVTKTPACLADENCTLQPLNFMGFHALTSFAITLESNETNTPWWVDDLSLGWSNNDCATAINRSKVRDSVRRRKSRTARRESSFRRSWGDFFGN